MNLFLKKKFHTLTLLPNTKSTTNIKLIEQYKHSLIFKKGEDSIFSSLKILFPFLSEDYERSKIIKLSFSQYSKLILHSQIIRFDQLLSKEKEFEENKQNLDNSSSMIILTSISNLNSNSNKENMSHIDKVLSQVISYFMQMNINNLHLDLSDIVSNNYIGGYILTKMIQLNYIPSQGIKTEIENYFHSQNFQSRMKEIESLYVSGFLSHHNRNDQVQAYSDYNRSVQLGFSLRNSRKYSNIRPNKANCDYIEELSYEIYSRLKQNNDLTSKIDLTIIKGNDLLKEGMNLFHSVGKSANTQPRLIILSYKGDQSSNSYTHCLLGKGLVFDNGGVNLKPTGYIEDMFLDKHGACNVLSVYESICKLNLKINIICAVGIAENAIGPDAYKPSEILISKKGLTVEIGNTDAEGRLVLADSLTYIQEKYNVKKIIDTATLTGACMVALGNSTAGVFGNSQSLIKNILSSSEYVNESMWHLPITRSHRKAISNGTIADLTNSSKGDRFGGASQAAAFLEAFINEDVEWCHLDIAGPSTKNGIGTGFGAKTILEVICREADERNKIDRI